MLGSNERQINRACHLLRTFNPKGMEHGVTESGAALARWGADSIEGLMKAMHDMIGEDAVAQRAIYNEKVTELARKLDSIVG